MNNQLIRASAVLVGLALFGCSKQDGGAASGSAAGSSSAAGTPGGTKACPEGYPYCVTLPPGWTLGKPTKGADWSNVAVFNDKKKEMATLYLNPAEKYDEMIAGDKMLTASAADKKEEAIADGKGVYTEWTFTKEYVGREHQIHAYVKDAQLWHCAAQSPKDAPIPEQVALCKSMVAK